MEQRTRAGHGLFLGSRPRMHTNDEHEWRNTMRLLLIGVLAIPVFADQLPYQKPNKEILDILNVPATPTLAVNPTRTYATLSTSERYPGIAEVSEPMLRLAGLRIG